MVYTFKAGPEAKKRAVIQTVLLYLLLLAVVFAIALHRAMEERVDLSENGLVLLFIVFFFSLYFFLAIRRARQRVDRLEITVTDEYVRVNNGRLAAKASFEEIGYIVRRPDKGLVIYLKDRKVPFLMLTARIERFGELEKLMAERCRVVEGNTPAFQWFNRLAWGTLTLSSFLVFVLSERSVPLLISGLVLFALALFSLQQMLLNRKNMRIRWLNLLVIVWLVVAVVIKLTHLPGLWA